jgi:hypothetical protein
MALEPDHLVDGAEYRQIGRSPGLSPKIGSSAR